MKDIVLVVVNEFPNSRQSIGKAGNNIFEGEIRTTLLNVNTVLHVGKILILFNFSLLLIFLIFVPVYASWGMQHLSVPVHTCMLK